MATIIDSYSESNQNGNQGMIVIVDYGQSFTGNGYVLSTAVFNLDRNNAVGTVRAKIYAHTGTFGTSSEPTGSPLATSNTINVSTITNGSFSLITFTFTGVDKITLVNGTHYVVVLEYIKTSGGILIGDAQPNTSSGNASNTYDGINWNIYSDMAIIFYVYGVAPATITGPFPTHFQV